MMLMFNHNPDDVIDDMERLGERQTALELLEQAVMLAEPGGFIRLFVDLGPETARLLKTLDLADEGQQYVGRVLAAFVDRVAAPCSFE